MDFRTDLAMEVVQLLDRQDAGITQRKRKVSELEITHITIDDDNVAKKLGKLKGEYITIEAPSFTDNFQDVDDKVEVISKQIRYLLPREGTIFVVGLGNEAITPDA